MDGSPSSAPVISVRGLTKRYSSTVLAVDDLTFTVEPGQVCGMLGPNGAGKTTTLRMLVGLVRPTKGEAALFGEDVRWVPEERGWYVWNGRHWGPDVTGELMRRAKTVARLLWYELPHVGFDDRKDGDTVQSIDGVDFLVDKFSAPYLMGANIDFVDGLNGAGFKIGNPNAKSTCGCGESFGA